MKVQDSIDAIIDRNSATYISLIAFREAAQRLLGIDKLPMVQSQDVKRQLRALEAASTNKQMMTYPFAYFNITRIAIDRDQMAIKTIARSGLGHTLDEVENAVIKKALMFPAIIGVELHYLTNDLIRAIDFSTRANLMAAASKLNSRVSLDGAEWFVEVRFPDTAVDFPRPDKDLEEDPEAFDLVINCEIHTKIGVMRNVPKVNNRGAVTVGTEVVGHGQV